MELDINKKSIGVKFSNGFNVYLQAITYGAFISKENPDPWLFPERKYFEWSFYLIPDDLEFWNHVLWVFPNPELIKRFIPGCIEICQNSKGFFTRYFIPF